MMPELWQLVVTQAWQIAVLTILVALLSRTVIRHRPHFAHALWLLVLIKCVTPPVWGHSLGLFSRLQAVVTTEAFSGPQLTVSTGPSEPADSYALEELDPESDLSAAIVAGGDADGIEVARSDPGERRPWNDEQPAEFSSIDHDASFPLEAVSWSFVLLMTAVVGGCLTLGVMVVRYLRCLRLISRGRTTEWDAVLNERQRLLAKQLGIRRVPQIVVSDVQFGPAVLGLFRHTIVLPKCLLTVRNRYEAVPIQVPVSNMPSIQSRSCLPGRTATAGGPAIPSATSEVDLRDTGETAQVAASREVPPGSRDVLTADVPSADGTQSFSCLPEFLVPILAHELLHLRRGDLLTGVLQAVAQCFWWFHPAVWYTNRWLSREAERCCDEQVIAELGCSPAEYARSLLCVIECKHQLHPVPVFPGMKPVEITSQRMERIMSLKNGLKKRTPVACWLLMAVLAVVILPGAASSVESRNQKPKIVEKSSTSTQSDKDSEPNIALNHSVQQKQQSVPVDSEKKIITRAYIISDLVLPAAENAEKLDLAPLVELIRTTVAPESWSKGNGEIRVDQNTGSLMIRHSRESHDEIARLLQAIRKNQTAVRLECRLLNLAEETSFQLIQNRCSLQPNGTGQSWALLTSASADTLLQSLKEQGSEMLLYAPEIIARSGRDSHILVQHPLLGSPPGFYMSVTPDPVPNSSVIRLKYSATMKCLQITASETTRFSFVGSDQTLLLVMEQPVDSKVSGAINRFIVMLTPSCVREETETLSSAGSEESSSSSDNRGPR